MSGGESAEVVILDSPDPSSLVLLITAGHLTGALDLESFAMEPCFVDTRLIETDLFGYPAQLLDATTGADCQVTLPLQGGGFLQFGERGHFYDIDTDAGRLILIVYKPANAFDQYFEDTVGPLLDSVRFIDD